MLREGTIPTLIQKSFISLHADSLVWAHSTYTSLEEVGVESFIEACYAITFLLSE